MSSGSNAAREHFQRIGADQNRAKRRAHIRHISYINWIKTQLQMDADVALSLLDV